MQPQNRKYILENAGTKTPAEIARELRLSEKVVRSVLSEAERPQKAAQPSAAPKPKEVRTAAAPGGWPAWLPIALITAAALLVYARTLGAGFVFDDWHVIERNPILRNPSLGALFDGFNTRLLVGVTLAFNYAVGGLNPAGYHLFNILIHAFCSVLVWQLAAVTLRTPAMREAPERGWADLLPLFAGLLFAVHPVQTQAVSYIWQRAASIGTFFYLSGLLGYVRWRLEGRGRDFALSLACVFAGMYAKEIVFTAPFAIALYEFFFFSAPGCGVPARWGRVACYLASLPIIPLLLKRSDQITLNTMRPDTLKVAGGSLDITRFVADEAMTRGHYLFTQLNVLRTYLRLLFYPAGQNVDYDYPIANGFGSPGVLLSLAVLAGLAAAGVWFFRRRRLLSFAIAWFFLTLSLESMVVQRDVLFEHRLYLPMVGFALFLPAALAPLLRVRAAAAGALAVIVLAAGFVSWQRNAVWHDELSLWKDVVQKSPNKARGHGNLAISYHQRKEYGEAVKHFVEAMRLDPKDPMHPYNAAATYEDMGDLNKALDSYRQALAIKPNLPKAYNNMGVVLVKMGRFSEAVSAYRRAIELDPGYEDAIKNLEVLSRRAEGGLP